MGYFGHNQIFPRLPKRFALNRKAEIATRWAKLAIEVLEDQGQIETQEIVGQGSEGVSAVWMENEREKVSAPSLLLL